MKTGQKVFNSNNQRGLDLFKGFLDSQGIKYKYNTNYDSSYGCDKTSGRLEIK